MSIHPPTSALRRLKRAGAAAVAVAMLTAGCQSDDTADPGRSSETTTEVEPSQPAEQLEDCAAPADPPTSGEVTATWAGGYSAKGKIPAEVELTNTSDLNAYNVHISVSIELYGEDVTDQFSDQLDESTSFTSIVRSAASGTFALPLEQPEGWPTEVVVSPDLVFTAEVTQVEKWCTPETQATPTP